MGGGGAIGTATRHHIGTSYVLKGLQFEQLGHCGSETQAVGTKCELPFFAQNSSAPYRVYLT